MGYNEVNAHTLANPEHYSVVQFLGGCRTERQKASNLGAALAVAEAMYKRVPRGIVIYAVLGSYGAIAAKYPGDKRMSDVNQYHLLAFMVSDAGCQAFHGAFATPEERDAAAGAEGLKNHAVVQINDIGEMHDKLNMAQLTAVHNLLRPDKPVKTFHDLGAGIPRVWNMMNGLTPDRRQAPAPAPAAAEPQTPGGAPAESEDEMAKSAAKRKAPAPRKGRASSFKPEAKITMLKTENPCREGTNRHKRWAALKTGMLVSTAIEKGVRSKDLARGVKAGLLKIHD